MSCTDRRVQDDANAPDGGIRQSTECHCLFDDGVDAGDRRVDVAHRRPGWFVADHEGVGLGAVQEGEADTRNGRVEQGSLAFDDVPVTGVVIGGGSPQLYLRDAGLAAFLCGVHTVDDLRATPFAGSLWETLVCAEIRRTQVNRHGRWNLHFWQDRAREADFLAHQAGRFHLADSKWTEQPRSRDAASLRKVLNVPPTDAVESLSEVCRTPNEYPLTDDVDAVRWMR